MRTTAYILLFFASLNIWGQERWTVERCIDYAVNHNHEVRQQAFSVDDYKSEKTKAIGAFLPYLEGEIGAQYNFGRTIDQETNAYTDFSTFYNNYTLSASIPIFDGFQRYNNLLASKANVLMGKSKLEAQKDLTAQNVLESYIQAVYCKGCVEIAEKKREESEMLLKQTKVMTEVGKKSEADVLQMAATFASDDYEVTHQKSLFEKALLILKRHMNYPPEDTLIISSADAMPKELQPSIDSEQEIFSMARLFMPNIKEAEYNLQSARYGLRSSKGALFPSISFGAGITTNYSKQLHSTDAKSFSEQFKNKVGEYFYASLSIPIFSRMNTISNIKRNRNNVRRAEEELENSNRELQRLIRETLSERENSWKQTEMMKKKVESDSIALRITVRKYEEGLSSAIDVQTQAVTLLQSEAQLLQCQLTYEYKTRMVNYYKGTPLYK